MNTIFFLLICKDLQNYKFKFTEKKFKVSIFIFYILLYFYLEMVASFDGCYIAVVNCYTRKIIYMGIFNIIVKNSL